MTVLRQFVSLSLSVLVVLTSVPRTQACGPSYIESIFVFRNSPDPPFEEFIQGKIGILQPTFGRKTLFIAYRHLNGLSFVGEEQAALLDALRARSPEDNISRAIKAWIETRKDLTPKDERLPEIYVEKRFEGYDFFPNCTSNAFEVATETLKDRVARYGAADVSVQEWLRGQDSVFEKCSAGGDPPQEIGPESPSWLRKDRDYQIAAALFYSLKFEEARTRFERIAADNESPWQETANYLVARTLVRQASLSEGKPKQHELYGQAEIRLRSLIRAGGKFGSASERLLALVKFRIHPEQRVRELAEVLSSTSGNEDLRQNLIDYVWLLDKFEAQLLKQEAERKKSVTNAEKKEPYSPFLNQELKTRYEAIQRGELIEIYFYKKLVDGKPDYQNRVVLDLRANLTEAEVLQSFEVHLGRKLTPQEQVDIKESHQRALSYRRSLISPNRKLNDQNSSQWEGCNYDCDQLPLEALPGFLRADDLSDWILTFQNSDPKTYAHALSRWRQTQSHAWFVSALAKAKKTSPRIEELIREAEKIKRDTPLFATTAHHLVRLKIDLGQPAEARKLLDEIISWQEGVLPISAQNQFLQQRMMLAVNVSEFLKFSARRPAAFYYEGALGKMTDLLEAAKRRWYPEDSEETKEEHDRAIESRYNGLLPWDHLVSLDDETIDILNCHFPLADLMAASRHPDLGGHLQRRLALAVWTRAILLKNDDVAQQIASDLIKVVPEMKPLLSSYLTSRTPIERQRAALFVLLKFPVLSPMIDTRPESFNTTAELDYYYQDAWWCPPSDTEVDNHGNDVPRVVTRPRFLTPEQLQNAMRERRALMALGDGKSYLGRQVLAWAKAAPDDPRIPEALFIAAKANESYKYGCDGWDHDEPTKRAAEKLLRARYSRSPWAAKLNDNDN